MKPQAPTLRDLRAAAVRAWGRSAKVYVDRMVSNTTVYVDRMVSDMLWVCSIDIGEGTQRLQLFALDKPTALRAAIAALDVIARERKL